MKRRTYQIRKQGQTMIRIANAGPDFELPLSETNWMDRYPQKSLLHDSEKNILWHVAKTVKGDIANLGHAQGGSAAVMGGALKFATSPHTVHSIDIFKTNYEERKAAMFNVGLDNVVLYRGFTNDVGAQWVKEGRQFDFTFIDAGHDYENVKQDFRLFSPMSRMVGFHDTNQIPTDDVINEDVLIGPWKLIHHVQTIKVFERV